MIFITSLQASVFNKARSDIPKSINQCVCELLNILSEINILLESTSPYDEEQRFGNTAFKWFHSKIESNYDNFSSRLLLKHSSTSLSQEIKNYFLDSFGSKMRLDYGTGHELNFLCVLLILFKVNYYAESDFPSIVWNVFYEYVWLVRNIQIKYNLEPAGAHGVWGLDEYHFLPFLFGAGQLVKNSDLLPSSLNEETWLRDYEKDYMYVNCIKYVKSVKKGRAFVDYAPVWNSISNVPSWDKVARGLVKMYEDEVLKKYVVVQHFYFGSIWRFD